MKVLFVLNGDYNEKLNNDFLNSYDIVVAVDGGLNNLGNFEPDYLIGDMDSINKKTSEKTKIIFKDNQDESDFLFALKQITTIYKHIENIDIICAIGSRIDHFLCTLLTLVNFDLKIKIIGPNEDIFLLKSGVYNLPVTINSVLSIIPLLPTKNIMTRGLKWEYEGIDLDFGFVNGVSNIALQDNILLSFDDGVVVVVINKI